ncbi:MAG: aspartate--ammonia ligase [bacterium]
MTYRKVGVPALYEPALDLTETLEAVDLVCEVFEHQLRDRLDLLPVPAPHFVRGGTGINDDLNGVEQPVVFRVRGLEEAPCEVPQSLAKWKRLALGELGFTAGRGIYTRMNALRPDEHIDPLHSVYVDQWDWEQVIDPSDRDLTCLMGLVEELYGALRVTERELRKRFPSLEPILPERVEFMHAADLAEAYPDLSPDRREDRAARQSGAVFIIGVGAPLGDGRPHGGRAPDYDDWITPNGRGLGLNGDLIVWHRPLDRALELSSMGIRVDAPTLQEQLRICGVPERSELDFHRRLLEGRLPQTAGGGIGRSRVCMYLLRKAHIGEVQASVWPDAMRAECARLGIRLLP